MEKLDIPFIKSRGLECGQTCAAMMIKYFYPDFEPDFEKFNKIIHHKKGKYTFPLQDAILLDHFGVKSMCFSSDDVKTSKQDPDQFKRWFGKDYDQIMKNIDVPGYDWW